MKVTKSDWLNNAQWQESYSEYSTRKRKEHYKNPDVRIKLVRNGAIVALGVIAVMQIFHVAYETFEELYAEQAIVEQEISELALHDGFDLEDTHVVFEALDVSNTGTTDIALDGNCTLTDITVMFSKNSIDSESNTVIDDVYSYSIPLQSAVLTVTSASELAEIVGENPCVTLNTK